MGDYEWDFWDEVVTSLKGIDKHEAQSVIKKSKYIWLANVAVLRRGYQVLFIENTTATLLQLIRYEFRQQRTFLRLGNQTNVGVAPLARRRHQRGILLPPIHVIFRPIESKDHVYG